MSIKATITDNREVLEGPIGMEASAPQTHVGYLGRSNQMIIYGICFLWSQKKTSGFALRRPLGYDQ